jgi:hypothetical protein
MEKREKRSQKSLKNETENKEFRFVHTCLLCVYYPTKFRKLQQKHPFSSKNNIFMIITHWRLQYNSDNYMNDIDL